MTYEPLVRPEVPAFVEARRVCEWERRVGVGHDGLVEWAVGRYRFAVAPGEDLAAAMMAEAEWWWDHLDYGDRWMTRGAARFLAVRHLGPTLAGAVPAEAERLWARNLDRRIRRWVDLSGADREDR